MSSISEYLLQRLVMMWHVLFIGILRNSQFPLTTVKGKQWMLYNVLADDIFVLQNIRTVKRGYNSVERKVQRFHNQTKHSLRFNGQLQALMGYLWLTRLLQFWLIKYEIFFPADTCMVRSGYRPKRDLHSVFFPFDYYTSLKYLQTIKYHIRRECKCVFLVMYCFR